ncbi:MAG TPA: MerR family transcriptional regulator [Williamwhitmania sp.]|nr:MerR family transcriptional regulator [Williamwhitmania sp.]
MAIYSIKDLELLTGIKAHTIRMWERRYHIVEPARTLTNIREYSDDDLKKLLNVSILNNCGMKISMLAHMSFAELTTTVTNVVDKHKSPGLLTEQLVIAMVNFDEKTFDDIINGSITSNGFGYALEKLIFPFLDKLGMMWQIGEIIPAHEHFASSLIRNRILHETGLLGPNRGELPKHIFFLPEGEYHELVLLSLNYLTRAKRLNTLYLGQSVPLADIISVGKQLHPKFFIFSATFPQPHKLDQLMKELSIHFPLSTIIGGGPALDEIKRKPKTFAKLSTLDDFQSIISKQGGN